MKAFVKQNKKLIMACIAAGVAFCAAYGYSLPPGSVDLLNYAVSVWSN